MKLRRNNPARRRGRLHPSVQRKLRIAVPYFAMGVLTLVSALVFFDPPNWLLWLPFAALFVLLEFFAVEVNDRLFQSSSIMVVMTAGVIFAIEPGSDAVFAMTLMACLGAVVPSDFRERRWFQPMANFGQFALSGAAAGLLLDLNLPESGVVTTDVLVRVAIASTLASLAYVSINNILVRKAVKTVYGNDNLQPWSQMHVLFFGQVVMGLIGGLIGAAYLIAGRDAVLVLIVGVYGIGHMSGWAVLSRGH